MKAITQISLALLLVLVTACGGGSTSPQGEMASIMTDMTAVLEGITDADSAKSAKSKLEPLAERMAKLTKEMQDAKPSTQAVNEEEAKKIVEATQKFAQEYARVMGDPNISKEISDVLNQTGQ